jgi:hypothetical protein
MIRSNELDASRLLRAVAARVPPALRGKVVVIGSIAAAWTFRDVSRTHAVATKDIDLLLRPAFDAVATAESLGQELLDAGWRPRYPNGREPGRKETHDDDLPALRLSPPDVAEDWFVELQAVPPPDQTTRKHWRRFHTSEGDFGLPSFRFMPVAVDDPEDTEFGLRVARPSRMALANLLEHADPDRTPIANLPDTPPRFVKDVGRAVALWWLAREQTVQADTNWTTEWRQTLSALYPDRVPAMKRAADDSLRELADYLPQAHAIARESLLAPHATTLDAFRRAHSSLSRLEDAL